MASYDVRCVALLSTTSCIYQSWLSNFSISDTPARRPSTSTISVSTPTLSTSSRWLWSTFHGLNNPLYSNLSLLHSLRAVLNSMLHRSASETCTGTFPTLAQMYLTTVSTDWWSNHIHRHCSHWFLHPCSLHIPISTTRGS
ncbi:hypothetical protein F383_03443 [Gossypium arboreum]|uniref:Uncharacterized protein n=1 Tax=Gossypium arboreum TaxID=29729 RepID=A0A0B0PGY8_GOSAR|nr:hypothetical protein F383_03443 [Gossypium arboreum]